MCLTTTGLLPLTLVSEDEGAQQGRLLYVLYGMYLAVLPARQAADEAARLGGDTASTVLGPTRGRAADYGQGYGWEPLAGSPLRPARVRNPCGYHNALWRVRVRVVVGGH